jgi:hypothetical protein
VAEEQAHRGDRRSNARPLVLALVALALVLSISVLVGFVGSPHTRFDWELASIFGTALGTTLLALATGGLAYSTRSEVRATQELAELTREDQAARDRPVVMVEQFHHDPGNNNGWLMVTLINVGLGPALRVQVVGEYLGEEELQPGIQEVTVAAIRPNERTEQLKLLVAYPEFDWGTRETRHFRITGIYEDRAGRGKYSIEQPGLPSS